MDQRVKFIAACRDRETSFAALCREFKISRKTGYKWLARYDAQGAAGLEERKPVARRRSHSTAVALVLVIVALRKEHPFWGPRKLRALLMQGQPELPWPAPSTIGDLLKRHGLIRPRKRRIHVARATNPLGPCRGANELWCIDFKGNFKLGDGRQCYPLTITDGHSRYLLKCEGMLDTKGPLVKRQMELAFAEFGLPERIRSDNGPPFATLGPGGLSMLSVWWLQLGIVHERIEPGKPQQNGSHERMHRTLKAEATQPAGATLAEQQETFDLFRREFNELRPHEALEQTTPVTRYAPSLRAYPRELATPSYGDEFKVRWANNAGFFSWRAKLVNAGRCLAGQPLGIRQISATRHEVHYGPVLLGILDNRDKEPTLRRPEKTVTEKPAVDEKSLSEDVHGESLDQDTPTAPQEVPSMAENLTASQGSDQVV